MPGLSQDPDARKRQLDALRKGREKAAKRWLGIDDPEPGQSTGNAPAPSQGKARASEPAGEHVLGYDDLDDPDDGEEDEDGGSEPEPEPARERGAGPLGRFVDGFTGG